MREKGGLHSRICEAGNLRGGVRGSLGRSGDGAGEVASVLGK